jgi:two-component system, NarL family, sensor histidine kinase BarA
MRAGYLTSLSKKSEELAMALDVRDFATAYRLGHQIKGSGRSYGLPEGSELGCRIEEAGENRRMPTLEAAVIELKELIGRLSKQHEAPKLP